jgi:hypothetical protein
MKYSKQFFLLFFIGLLFYTCGSSPIKNKAKIKEKPVVIANDSLEYEVIIFDIGFNLYLNSIAKPRVYYSQNYLENRNRFFVINWNMRALNPNQFNPNIYQNVIDYEANVDYGYEVNYLLFNYFLFAQQKYKMSLGVGFPGRIN